MKLIRHAATITMIAALAGCGHGFEGEYKSATPNAFLNALGAQAEVTVIGSDYIETEGKRTRFDDIFVRESGGEKYLVFKSGESEEAWKIVNDKTLMQRKGLFNVTLTRAK